MLQAENFQCISLNHENHENRFMITGLDSEHADTHNVVGLLTPQFSVDFCATFQENFYAMADTYGYRFTFWF